MSVNPIATIEYVMPTLTPIASWLRTKVSITGVATSVDDPGRPLLDHALQQLEFPLAADRVVLDLAEDAVEAADVVEPLADRFTADVRKLLGNHRHHHHRRVVRVGGEGVGQTAVARLVALIKVGQLRPESRIGLYRHV